MLKHKWKRRDIVDRNIARSILLRIDKIKVGESILIGDLRNEFSNVDPEDFLSIIAKLTARYYIRIDGKYSHDCYSIEKYNKIVGLDREGLEAIDYIKNEKIWAKLEDFLNKNNYNDFTIFNAIEFAKEMMKKEFENILNK